MAVQRAEQARRFVYGPSGSRRQPVARGVAGPTMRQAPAAAQARIAAGRPDAAGYPSSPAQTNRMSMTHVVQTNRQTNTEIDRSLLERTVTQSVSRSVSETLSRTVDETVRRQLTANSRTRSSLIDQLGSDLYDQVTLERERVG